MSIAVDGELFGQAPLGAKDMSLLKELPRLFRTQPVL
jgi:hypothetical protein